MESPGEYLKREREIRGISLEGISDTTKIRTRLLNALENNDFGALPAVPFVKGFIQAYCNYLGLDAQDALLRYESYVKSVEENKVAALEKEAEANGRKSETHPPYQAVSITAIVVIAFLVIITGIYIIASKSEIPAAPEYSQPQPEKSVAEPKIEAPPQQMAAETQTDIASSTPSLAPLKENETPTNDAPPVQDINKENLSLVIEASKPAWIKAEIDGGTPFEVSLKEGEKVKWSAEEKFSILIGNAGGVHVIFNGSPLKKMGEDGEVVRLILPEQRVEILNPEQQPHTPTL